MCGPAERQLSGDLLEKIGGVHVAQINLELDEILVAKDALSDVQTATLFWDSPPHRGLSGTQQRRASGDPPEDGAGAKAAVAINRERRGEKREPGRHPRRYQGDTC